MMLPKLLPNVDEIIYADVDVVFCNDLAEAAALDMKDNLVAGVLDLTATDYINAGFLIMNLKQIRKEKIYEKWISEAEQKEFEKMDQDVLNAVCKNRIVYLPHRYNFSPKQILNMKLSEQEFQDMKYHMVMVHYGSWMKPWKEVKPRLSHIWQHFADKTGLF
ncbi:MAG: hypothetical protein LBL46_04370 [Rickettsiales bacterium]|jgi:lipopolysaccharide biosynthesis glycosyltransferase|nr:hypothetical protein [Rickettsiales bacterium]